MNNRLISSFALASSLFLSSSQLGIIKSRAPVPGTHNSSFDIYPSVVEYSGDTEEGVHVIVQCGWDVGPDGISRLNGYRRFAQDDASKATWKDDWTIDGTIVTVASIFKRPHARDYLGVTETFRDARNIASKTCAVDTYDNTYANCTSNSGVPLNTFEQASVTQNKLTKYCRDLFKKSYWGSFIQFAILLTDQAIRASLGRAR